VDNHHFEDNVGGVDPFLHDVLEEVLSGEDSLFLLQLDVNSDQHFIDLLILSIHDGVGESDDWFHDEGAESSLDWFSLFIGVVLLPLLGGWVEIVVSPKSFHHLWNIGVELLGIDLGELGHGEGVAFLSGSEGDVSSGWVEDKVSHFRLFIVGDDDIDHIDDSDEVLIHALGVILEFQDLSVDLVYHQYRLNLFG